MTYRELIDLCLRYPGSYEDHPFDGIAPGGVVTDIPLVMPPSDPFGFERLHYIQSVMESKQLNVRHKPCVIISASGMMEAGRVKHHIANHIENPSTTILCVGYCEPSTLGAKIMRGDEEVSIFGQRHKVRAELRRIDGLSGHGDYKEMIRYIGCQDQKKVRRLFLVHGEAETQQHFAATLAEAGWKRVSIPGFREEVEL